MKSLTTGSLATHESEHDNYKEQSLRGYLRDGTSANHQRVDEQFARFNLNDRHDYISFLSAHARALLPIEAALDQQGAHRIIPEWSARRRSDMLCADLNRLNAEIPPSLAAPQLKSDAQIWGAAYVLEGSKLGGAFLAKGVPDNFPTSFLTPNMAKGSMKLFMDSLDRADVDHPVEALGAAAAVFGLFLQAARLERERLVS